VREREREWEREGEGEGDWLQLSSQFPEQRGEVRVNNVAGTVVPLRTKHSSTEMDNQERGGGTEGRRRSWVDEGEKPVLCRSELRTRYCGLVPCLVVASPAVLFAMAPVTRRKKAELVEPRVSIFLLYLQPHRSRSRRGGLVQHEGKREQLHLRLQRGTAALPSKARPLPTPMALRTFSVPCPIPRPVFDVKSTLPSSPLTSRPAPYLGCRYSLIHPYGKPLPPGHSICLCGRCVSPMWRTSSLVLCLRDRRPELCWQLQLHGARVVPQQPGLSRSTFGRVGRA